MKLLRLKLDVAFRSLPRGFEIHFLREEDLQKCFVFNPYCLAGRNGSGKSNVLEAIAAIFYHIECIYLNYRPDGFEYDSKSNPRGFRAEVCTPDAFEIEYLFPNDSLEPLEPWPEWDGRPVARIVIRKAPKRKPEIHWVNRAEFEKTDSTELSRAEVKDYLPRYIVGYSSGHNEILSLPFFKMRFIHLDEYRDHLTKDVPYFGHPEGRMIYIDDHFSQTILLCHFLFPCDAITRVFEEKVGLKGFQCFRIIIRRHHRENLADERLKTLTAAEKEDPEKTTVELTDILRGTIEKLRACATTYYEDYRDEEGSDLYLDYWINDATRDAFYHHFRSESGGSEEVQKAACALNLFQALRTLLTLNYYLVDTQTKVELYQSGSLYVNETIPIAASHQRIMRIKEGELIKHGARGNIYIKALSDGEHQLLHTIGLCLLFRHEPTLFLLDEPETHLNPDWRASFITTLRQALEADPVAKTTMREVLLTSHSPFIISDCSRENVLVFTKDAVSGAVAESRPEFETFGASANAVTIKIFEHKETIGDHAMSKLTGLRERLEVGEDADKLIDEANALLGDSVEKVLFINQALSQKGAK